MTPISVSFQDRKVTLRGVVATDRDRALAANMALMEPGVSQVDNQLTVAPPAQTPETPSEP